jgi:hypothetical protein
MGPRAVLDAVVKRKIPSPPPESNPRTPIAQPVAQCYTDWVTTAVKVKTVRNTELNIFDTFPASERCLSNETDADKKLVIKHKSYRYGLNTMMSQNVNDFWTHLPLTINE